MRNDEEGAAAGGYSLRRSRGRRGSGLRLAVVAVRILSCAETRQQQWCVRMKSMGMQLLLLEHLPRMLRRRCG